MASTFSLFLTGIVACFLFFPVHSENFTGLVVSITDGDTIKVLDKHEVQHTIRLAGIDSPEKKQAYGQQSKQSLSELVFKRDVFVETSKTDRYGRDIGKVLVDGVDTNLEQVKRGLAWHYKAYQGEQTLVERLAYARAEEEARRQSQGIWQDVHPVPPWEFRQKSYKTKE